MKHRVLVAVLLASGIALATTPAAAQDEEMADLMEA